MAPRNRFAISLLILQAAAVLFSATSSVASVEASRRAPGGLAPIRTPQFILFAHDDAITSATYEAMRAVTDGRQSSNGCPATATMFTTSTGTDCDLLMDLYNSGFEIADHTVSHLSLKGMKRSQLKKEVLGARAELAACGIPESDIVGLRAPFLESDPALRELLHSSGFLYDSSLIEEGTGASLSGGMDARVWPFDMASGLPMNCAWFSGTQECTDDEAYAGLYEVPVWQLLEGGSVYAMDYGGGDSGSLFKFLKDTFDAAYNGNRAPFPLFIHTPWLQSGDNLDDLGKFVDYALSQPDTYLVTVRQLLAWMQNPVAADELTPEALGCGNAGGAGPSSFRVPAHTPSVSSADDEEPVVDDDDAEWKLVRGSRGSASSSSTASTGTTTTSSTGSGGSASLRSAWSKLLGR